jgi:hypothetical protein
MDKRAKFGLSALTLFAAFVLLAVTTRTYPPRPGSLVPTGSTSVARFSHTATLLENDKVLIAGGMERNGVWLDSAELYDPATGQFAATGKMSTRRAGATATLLPNGTVLIAGGNDGSGNSLASSEIFNPATRTFSPGANMTMPRGHAVAVPLKTGKILIVGGNRAGDNETLATAELYDSATGRFSATGSMHTPRIACAVVRMQDGRILVAGGVSRGRYPDHVVEASAEIYDPGTERFTPTGSMGVARYKVGAALLPNGRVLVVGGSDSRDWRGMYSSTEIYDPSAGHFYPGPEMRSKRFKLSEGVVLLKDRRVFIAGGANRPEIYDASSASLVSANGDSMDGFFFSSATLLNDGRVLLVGGYGMNPGAGAVNHAWLWEP